MYNFYIPRLLSRFTPEAGGERKKGALVPTAKPDAKAGGGEAERSDSDDSLEPER